MDTAGSLNDFFYFIVPGASFIFGLNYYHIHIVIFPKNDFGGLNLFWLVIFSIFLGFGFFGSAKIIRLLGFDNWIIRKVIHDDPTSYEKAKAILIKQHIYTTGEKPKQVFYKMDNYLRKTNPPSFIVNNFCSRITFWSNTFIAALCFEGIAWLYHTNLPWEIWIVVVFSVLMYYLQQRSFYDTIVKTFVTYVSIEKGLKPYS